MGVSGGEVRSCGRVATPAILSNVDPAKISAASILAPAYLEPMPEHFEVD